MTRATHSAYAERPREFNVLESRAQPIRSKLSRSGSAQRNSASEQVASASGLSQDSSRTRFKHSTTRRDASGSAHTSSNSAPIAARQSWKAALVPGVNSASDTSHHWRARGAIPLPQSSRPPASCEQSSPVRCSSCATHSPAPQPPLASSPPPDDAPRPPRDEVHSALHPHQNTSTATNHRGSGPHRPETRTDRLPPRPTKFTCSRC
jgi:hypothetical protein